MHGNELWFNFWPSPWWSEKVVKFIASHYLEIKLLLLKRRSHTLWIPPGEIMCSRWYLRTQAWNTDTQKGRRHALMERVRGGYIGVWCPPATGPRSVLTGLCWQAKSLQTNLLLAQLNLAWKSPSWQHCENKFLGPLIIHALVAVRKESNLCSEEKTLVIIVWVISMDRYQDSTLMFFHLFRRASKVLFVGFSFSVVPWAPVKRGRQSASSSSSSYLLRCLCLWSHSLVCYPKLHHRRHWNDNGNLPCCFCS